MRTIIKVILIVFLQAMLLSGLWFIIKLGMHILFTKLNIKQLLPFSEAIAALIPTACLSRRVFNASWNYFFNLESITNPYFWIISMGFALITALIVAKEKDGDKLTGKGV